jgi:hypothetical protein
VGRKTNSRDRHTELFAENVATWIARNAYLIDALVGLRRLGDEAADAVDAVLKVRRVEQFRLGWELAVALAEGDGGNPYLDLTVALGAELLRTTVVALWGSPWDAPQERGLRSVQ